MGLFGFLKPKNRNASSVQDAARQIARAAFPDGEKQIIEGTDQLYTLLKGKLPKAEVRQLLCRSKALLVIAEDKTESRMIPSIEIKAAGKLTPKECQLVYAFLLGEQPLGDSERDGSTREKAVVISATSSFAGIDAEYRWLEARLGRRDVDWSLEMQMNGEANGRTYDTFILKMADGSSKSVHFDISSFFGRF